MSGVISIMNNEESTMETIGKNQPDSVRLLKLAEVLNLLSISKAYHFALLNENSRSFDPTYPKQISIGVRAVRYSQKEVINWINSKRKES
jgi:prophage regulatory protein